MQNKSHVRCLPREFFFLRDVVWLGLSTGLLHCKLAWKKKRKCCLLYKKAAIFLFIAFLCFSAVSQVKIWLFLLFVVDATTTVAIFPWIDSIPPLSHTHDRRRRQWTVLLIHWLTRSVVLRGILLCTSPECSCSQSPAAFRTGKTPCLKSRSRGNKYRSKKAEYTTGGFSPSVPLFNLALKLNNSTTQSWMPRKKKVALPLPFCTAPKKIKVSFFLFFVPCCCWSWTFSPLSTQAQKIQSWIIVKLSLDRD